MWTKRSHGNIPFIKRYSDDAKHACFNFLKILMEMKVKIIEVKSQTLMITPTDPQGLVGLNVASTQFKCKSIYLSALSYSSQTQSPPHTLSWFYSFCSVISSLGNGLWLLMHQGEPCFHKSAFAGSFSFQCWPHYQWIPTTRVPRSRQTWVTEFPPVCSSAVLPLTGTLTTCSCYTQQCEGLLR